MASIEFCLQYEQQEQEQPDKLSHSQRLYCPLEEHQQTPGWSSLVQLQQLLKEQHLLLEHQQQRKAKRLKQISYNYTNAFTNYLWAHSPRRPFILLTPKDQIALDQHFPNHVQGLLARLNNPKPLPLSTKTNPTTDFLMDFMNFWPLWHLRIQQFMENQVSEAANIDSAFESQYTLASKTLAHLRFNDSVRRFCAQLFEPTISELQSLKNELNLDFGHIYEKWSEAVEQLKHFKRFIDGGDFDLRQIKPELQTLIGKTSQHQARKLVEQMISFSRKKTALSFLEEQLGEQQAIEGINLRLGWLAWHQLTQSRRKLQGLATGLVSSIINSGPKTPPHIRWVIGCYQKSCSQRFGPLSFQDLKSFFNKVIFSQLFFAEFMQLHQRRCTAPYHTANLTTLALLSQKIMFGQQFYQKFKFAFLNPTIDHFMPNVDHFIKSFANGPPLSPQPQFPVAMLSSLQSLQTVYLACRDQLPDLGSLQVILCNASCHYIGTGKYDLKDMYVGLVQPINLNYTRVLHPKHKVQRVLIEFLLMIETISEKKSLKALLEHYRVSEEDQQQSKPSVQLYAIFLSETLDQSQLQPIMQTIHEEIATMKKTITEYKVCLEKQYAYSLNLEKVFMEQLNQKREKEGLTKIGVQIEEMLDKPLGFNYEIIEGKICESESEEAKKTLQESLHDVGECFGKGFEGVDGLYHIIWQRVAGKLQKGLVPDNLIDKVKQILGEKLYQILDLSNARSEADSKLWKQMEKHAFVDVSMLDLPQYTLEQELIEKETSTLIEQLQQSACPERILKVFNEIKQVFERVILITGSPSDITADVEIPLMLVTLIKGRIRNLASLLSFIQLFCDDDINNSVLGQTFTLLKSAVVLISELSRQRLSIDQQTYDQLTISSSYMIVQ